MAAHITNFIVANAADYFSAHLDNGWVRVGLRGCECFDFAPTHAEYARVVVLAGDGLEAAHDEFMGRYVCA